MELLVTELSSIAKKWYEFGQKMGVRTTQLHLVEHERGQEVKWYFKELLGVMCEEESGVEVTWVSVVRAVREIGEGALGDRLTEKYG